MRNIKVSVVVPTYHRPQLLRRCLEALKAQDCFYSFEIIVADDGNDLATQKEVREFNLETKIPLYYLAVEGLHHGPAAARNQGWRAAHGEIIAFTDDDCVPSPGWLRHGIEAFGKDVNAVWGRLVMPIPENPTDYEYNAAHLERAEFVTANCFCRREALVEIHGFDEHFERAWREDSDLFFSLSKLPGKIIYADTAVVTHPVRPAPWGISLKQQSNNLYEALLFKKHPQLYRQSTAVPWDYYWNVLAFFFAVFFALNGWAWPAFAFGLIWTVLIFQFFFRRLRNTSRDFNHVFEMAVTSVLIPPAAIFWRLAGALKFRVFFL